MRPHVRSPAGLGAKGQVAPRVWAPVISFRPFVVTVVILPRDIIHELLRLGGG